MRFYSRQVTRSSASPSPCTLWCNSWLLLTHLEQPLSCAPVRVILIDQRSVVYFPQPLTFLSNSVCGGVVELLIDIMEGQRSLQSMECPLPQSHCSLVSGCSYRQIPVVSKLQWGAHVCVQMAAGCEPPVLLQSGVFYTQSCQNFSCYI